MIFKKISKEFSLISRNIQSRRGHFQPGKQQYFVLHDILSKKDFEQIRELVINKKSLFIRQDSTIRKGSTISGHELKNSPLSKLVDHIDCNKFIEEIQTRTDITKMQFVPEVDTNRISLLSYNNRGDGIDWHIDGSIYLGDRWAGILTIIEDIKDPNSKLELKPNGQLKTFPVSEMINTLVLFQGDQMLHRARPMLENEERIVVSLLFSPNPTRTKNPILRLYQAWVNYIFYGNPRA